MTWRELTVGDDVAPTSPNLNEGMGEVLVLVVMVVVAFHIKGCQSTEGQDGWGGGVSKGRAKRVTVVCYVNAEKSAKWDFPYSFNL